MKFMRGTFGDSATGSDRDAVRIQALDALNVGIQRKKVNWILDADIRGFFDRMSHEWTVKFIQHRIADKRILRLIQKWLKAGVSEDGEWSETTEGTPQGAVKSICGWKHGGKKWRRAK
jgi:retron-type reverse transcriptase